MKTSLFLLHKSICISKVWSARFSAVLVWNPWFIHCRISQMAEKFQKLIEKLKWTQKFACAYPCRLRHGMAVHMRIFVFNNIPFFLYRSSFFKESSTLFQYHQNNKSFRGCNGWFSYDNKNEHGRSSIVIGKS